MCKKKIEFGPFTFCSVGVVAILDAFNFSVYKKVGDLHSAFGIQFSKYSFARIIAALLVLSISYAVANFIAIYIIVSTGNVLDSFIVFYVIGFSTAIIVKKVLEWRSEYGY